MVPVAALLLWALYGSLLSGDVSEDGSLFIYNPTTKAMGTPVVFGTSTGAVPRGALIEDKDRYLYGINSLYGGADSIGQDGGTLYRVGPPLSH